MSNANRVLTGSNGHVWLNNQLLAQVKSIEAKIAGNFEEVTFVGDYATHNIYTGWAGEGTLTLQKVDSTALSLVGDSFKKGVLPDIKIVTELKDHVTGKAERVAISNVVISEFMLTKFEGKAIPHHVLQPPKRMGAEVRNCGSGAGNYIWRAAALGFREQFK